MYFTFLSIIENCVTPLLHVQIYTYIFIADNRLINCRNHILEFKENMLHLRNKTEKNSQEMMKVLNRIKYEITKRENLSGNLGLC